MLCAGRRRVGDLGSAGASQLCRGEASAVAPGQFPIESRALSATVGDRHCVADSLNYKEAFAACPPDSNPGHNWDRGRPAHPRSANSIRVFNKEQILIIIPAKQT